MRGFVTQCSSSWKKTFTCGTFSLHFEYEKHVGDLNPRKKYNMSSIQIFELVKIENGSPLSICHANGGTVMLRLWKRVGWVKNNSSATKAPLKRFLVSRLERENWAAPPHSRNSPILVESGKRSQLFPGMIVPMILSSSLAIERIYEIIIYTGVYLRRSKNYSPWLQKTQCLVRDGETILAWLLMYWMWQDNYF